MMHCHFLRGLRWASCWDRKWRKMWKVWTRVSPALTSVSLTRSWSPHTLHKAMRDWCVDDQPDTDVMCFFYHAQPKDSETTRVVPHPTTSWGARSHSESPTYNHHPDWQTCNLPTTSEAEERNIVFSSLCSQSLTELLSTLQRVRVVGAPKRRRCSFQTAAAQTVSCNLDIPRSTGNNKSKRGMIEGDSWGENSCARH